MGADRVLLVAREGWVLRLLEEGLRDEGLVVASATRSDLALGRIQDMEPDCVVVDTELDDHDGYWVTVQVRGLSGPVAITPIALLAADDDAEARTRAFEAGADVLLTRPFRLDEILAQVRALVDFARRMRARRTSLMGSLHASTAGPPSSPEAAAFRAELAQMPVSGLLTLLELERKSGLVSVRSGGRRVTLDLQSGYVTGATVDTVGVPILEAIALAVAWREGTITFRAGFAVEPPAEARPIRALLAELRARDEAPVTPLAVELAQPLALAAPVPASAPSGDVPSEPVGPLASEQSGARQVRPKLEADAGSEPEPIEDIGVLLGLDDIFDPPRLPAPPPTPSIVPPPKPMGRNGEPPRPAMTTTATPTHRAPPPDAGRSPPDRSPPSPPDRSPRRPALADAPVGGDRGPVPSVAPDTRQVEVPEVRAEAPAKLRAEPRPSPPSEPAPISGDGDADSARSTLRPWGDGAVARAAWMTYDGAMADDDSRTGSTYLSRPIVDWLAATHAPHDPALQAAFDTPKTAGIPAIHVGATEGKTLALLLRLVSARRVVEIGTLAGYSTIHLARALPPDGHVDTLELDPRHAALARANLEAAGVAPKVTVHVGSALEILPRLAAHGPYCAVFVDADKGNYDHYGRWAAANVRPGGLLLGDNAHFFGNLLGEGEAAAAMRRFHEEARAAFDTVCLPTPDGLLLGVRRSHSV